MPVINITKKSVDALPFAKSIRKRYRDAKLSGFFLRVGADKKVYFVEKKINGKPVKFTIGPHGQISPELARKEAQRLLGLMSTGHNPNAAKRAERNGRISLKEVFEDFLEARKSLSEKTIYDYGRILKTVFKDWCPKSITEINMGMIARRHKKIGEQNGGAYANLSMRFLRALFNFAAGQYEKENGQPLIIENPVKRLSQTRAWYRVERRKTVIQPHDLPAWYQSVIELENETFRNYFLILLFTGLRRQEAARLKWEDVDFKAKSLTVANTKNRETLLLPLSEHVFCLFKKMEANTEKWNSRNEHVFPGEGSKGHIIEPRPQMKKIIAASGVNFTLHDLRRTFISTASSLVTAYELKQLVNHKTGGDVTAGYIVPDVERLRRPMERITDHLLKLAGVKQDGKIVEIPIKRTAR